MEVRILNHIDRDCVDYAIRIESLGQSVEVNTDTTYYMKKRDGKKWIENFMLVIVQDLD